MPSQSPRILTHFPLFAVGNSISSLVLIRFPVFLSLNELNQVDARERKGEFIILPSVCVLLLFEIDSLRSILHSFSGWWWNPATLYHLLLLLSPSPTTSAAACKALDFNWRKANALGLATDHTHTGCFKAKSIQFPVPFSNFDCIASSLALHPRVWEDEVSWEAWEIINGCCWRWWYKIRAMNACDLIKKNNNLGWLWCLHVSSFLASPWWWSWCVWNEIWMRKLNQPGQVWAW